MKRLLAILPAILFFASCSTPPRPTPLRPAPYGPKEKVHLSPRQETIAPKSQAHINFGAQPNDYTGDTPRAWAMKDEANFSELYASLKAAGVPTNTIVNLKQFSAVGNGVADDTQAFNDALSYLKSTITAQQYVSHFTYPVDVSNYTARAALYVPPGVYKVSSTLSNWFSFLDLVGAGEDETVIWFTPTNSPCIRFSGDNDPFWSDAMNGHHIGKRFKIRNLTVRGNNSRFQPHSAASILNSGIEFDGLFHGEIENVKVYDFGGDGLGFYKQQWTHAKNVWVFYCRVGLNIDCTRSTVDTTPFNNVTSTFTLCTFNNNDQGVIENGTSENVYDRCVFEGNVGEFYHATVDGTYNGAKLEPDLYFLPSVNFNAKNCDFTTIRDSYFEQGANDIAINLARVMHVENCFFNPTDLNDPTAGNGVEFCARQDIIYRDNFFGYNRSGVNANLFGIAYGASKYVAVGFGGAVATSSDGITWANQTFATNNTLKAILFNSPTFVTVGGIGTISTSTNATSWTLQTSPTTNNLSGLAFGGGTYVAVGDSGTIVTSTDAATWTQRTSGTTESLSGVTYGGGQFVAVGTTAAGGGIILTSPDGTTWTQRTAPAGVTFLSVAYSGSKFAAVGSGIATSPDGITWTVQTSPALVGYVGITYGNGLFVAAGSTIVTSPDGTTWTAQTTGTTRSEYCAIYGGSQYVAAGESGLFLTSPDGTSWTLRPTSNPATDFTTLNSDTRSHQSFILFENDGSGYGGTFKNNWFANQTTIKGTNDPSRKVIKFKVANFQYPKFDNCSGMVFTNQDTIFDGDPVIQTNPIARIEWVPQDPIDNPRGILALKTAAAAPVMASTPTRLTSLAGIFPATVSYSKGLFEHGIQLGGYVVVGNATGSITKPFFVQMNGQIGIGSGPMTDTNSVPPKVGAFILYDGSLGATNCAGWLCISTNGQATDCGSWVQVPTCASPLLVTPTIQGNATIQTGLHFSNAGYLAGTGLGTFYLLHENGSSPVGLQLGGTSSSYPGLYNVSTTIKARLADNSADAPFAALNFTANGLAGISQTNTWTATGTNWTDVITGGIITSRTHSP